MEKDDLIIPIRKPSIDFQKHLDIEGNSRIIFSGMFGTGKTYFLDKFFGELTEKEESRYNYIHLLPIHYSVSANEDIFEYVKYDIASRLLSNGKINFDSNELARSLHHSMYLYSKPADLLSPLLNFIPIIGEAAVSAYEKWMDLVKKIEEDYKEKSTGENERLKKYIESSKSKIGTIYENDFYTTLIRKLLESWSNSRRKKNILIIDDLDRIDPEHIFRLFNVFGAHTSANIQDTFENKFGFDKIIFVCDIHNIRNIFRAKYGEAVDFSGYIDKFYSIEIFNFENKQALLEEIGKVVRKLKLTSQRMEQYEIDHYNGLVLNSNKLNETLLLLLIFSNSISLRTILKKFNNSMEYTREFYALTYRDKISDYQLPITITLYMINNIIGNKGSLLDYLHKCRNFDLSHFKMDKRDQLRLLNNIIHIVDYKNNRFHPGNYKYNFNGINFLYTLKKEYDNSFASSVGQINEQNWEQFEGDIKVIDILIRTIEVLNLTRTY